MKRKNLERAVLLTLMLMSLHGVAGAEAVTNNNIDTGTTTTVDSITVNDENEYNVTGNGELSVDFSGKKGTGVNAENNSKLTFNNKLTNVTASMAENAMKTDNANITFSDESKLSVDFKNSDNGIRVTGNNGEFNIGEAGADIKTNTTTTSGMQKGIYQDSGTFIATGKLNIDLSSNPLVYLIGVDLRTANGLNNPIMNINNADIKIVGKSGNQDSVAILNQGGDFVANGKLVIDVSGGSQTNYGIDAGFGETSTNISDAEITVTSSGSSSSSGIFSREGSTLTAGNLNITAQGNGVQNIGIYTYKKENSKVEFAGGQLVAKNGQSGFGIKALGGEVISNGDLIIKAEGAGNNFAVQAENIDTQVTLNGTTSITSKGNTAAFGLVAGIGGTINSTGKTIVVAEGGTASNAGIYGNGGNITANDVNVTVSGNNAIGVYAKQGLNNSTGEQFDANVNIKGTAVIDSATTAYALNKGSGITFEKSLVADNGTASQILAATGGTVNINSTGEGTVIYRGVTGLDADSAINMNLNNEQSVWNLTGDSKLTALSHSNGAVIDMTQDKGAFSALTVEKLTADENNNGGVIKMNIDGDAVNTADRLYITGEHTGNHFISIDDTVTENAVGTVLVSVGTEKGTFAAEKTEGALYWNDYDLEQVANADEGDAYNTDWVIAAVKQDESQGTTSVDTIVGANALNYHTWRAENDQLMRRMGELRANGADEQGAWFRVHGSKISHDDIAGFENQYTSYELGYDQVTKQTEDMTRYTGAALSYTDGSSSYDSGSGENHSKALSFYNTDIYKSGHYLDLVFKYANMDNDFSVYDTAGQNITGEYKNNGISVSAEYGRKNDLNGGWYIEPQAQLTLGYFGGDDYETSNGIKVEQSGITSVLGRVGFNIGKELGDSGVIYAKANLLHEFGGGYDIDMYDNAGNSRTQSDTFNDTWFEYGIGAALKTGKNNHLYFDFVKTAGGDFEKDWQWNAGMRWTF